MGVRVIAGEHRGRKLVSPPGATTRPTSDRVREAMFNALGSLGLLEGARVLDAFAGSGALGIEAISRGAESVVFLDSSRDAIDAIRSNVDALAIASAADIMVGDTLLTAPRLGRFDLALLDPPYRYERWAELLGAVDAEYVVTESDRPVEVGASWDVLRSKAYGGTVVEIVRRVQPGDPQCRQENAT